MAQSSHIEWTDATWNPVTGCRKVSPGCDSCYAIRDAHRMAGNPNPKVREAYAGLTMVQNGRLNWTGEVHCLPERLEAPLSWRKPRRVFVNSQSDLFHEGIPFEFIDRVFAVMALAPQHVFQVLTKRPERMLEYLLSVGQQQRDPAGVTRGARLAKWVNETWGPECLGRLMAVSEAGWWEWQQMSNVWFGTSCEDQRRADERIPLLLRTPAAVRFVSAEPLLGPVNLSEYLHGHEENGIAPGRPVGTCIAYTPPLDWVIAGGESGPRSRPCDFAWLRSLRDQCQAAGVAFFCKQVGAAPFVMTGNPSGTYRPRYESRKGGDMAEWPADLRVRQFPEAGDAA